MTINHLFPAPDGLGFDPLQPAPENVQPHYIGRNLAMINRFNGDLPLQSPYSVLEHSLRVATLAKLWISVGRDSISPEAPKTLFRQALLHDAAEAFVGDIILPIKHRLTLDGEPFEVAEQRLLTHIYAALGVPLPDDAARALIDTADRTLLCLEFVYIRGWELEQSRRVVRGYCPDLTLPSTAELALSMWCDSTPRCVRGCHTFPNADNDPYVRNHHWRQLLLQEFLDVL